MKRLGIDIGSDSIKLVELDDKKGRLEIIKCAMARIANGDKKSALRELLSQARLTMKHVNVSLSGTSVIVRYIEMPVMKKEELKSAIKFEAEKYIPFNINEFTIDCAMLDRAASGSQRVLLVAAKKQEVNSLLEFFKDLGLEIGVIDIDSFALFNSFQRTRIENKDESTYALMNIGAKFSNMNIATKQNAYFTRDILWGGLDITTSIKDAMGVSQEEAEVLKHTPGERREDIVNILAPVLEKFVSQIRMSFDYFETQFGKDVERLYISGGTSYLFNIIDVLGDNLGIEAKMWNPFEGLKSAEPIKEMSESPALFAVAIGLALRK